MCVFKQERSVSLWIGNTGVLNSQGRSHRVLLCIEDGRCRFMEKTLVLCPSQRKVKTKSVHPPLERGWDFAITNVKPVLTSAPFVKQIICDCRSEGPAENSSFHAGKFISNSGMLTMCLLLVFILFGPLKHFSEFLLWIWMKHSKEWGITAFGFF